MNKELQNEYAQLHTENASLISKVATEKRKFTAEEEQTKEARFARMDEIRAQDEAEKRLAAYAFEIGKVEETVSKAKAEFEKHQTGGNYSKKDAINAFLRGNSEPAMKFALTTGTNSSIMLPKEVSAPLTVLRNVNAWRTLIAAFGVTPIESTTADQLVVPVWDDTANIGAAIAETTTTDTQADSLTTGSVTLNPVLYTSDSKWFSNTFLMAEGFDVLSYVLPILSKMLDKAQESAYTATAKTVTANAYTGSITTGITYADILAWEHTLPPAYRYDAGFVVSDGLYKAIRGLVDVNLRPIMDLDPTNVFQGKLHNKPIIVSDYFDAPLTAAQASSSSGISKVGGAFVSAQAVIMRDVVPQRLTRYVNVPTYKDQTGLELFANGDCNFVSSGLSLFKFKTS